MLHVTFLPDRIVLETLRASRKISTIKCSGLSNGEFGCLLRIGSHPDAVAILDGRVSPREAGVSVEQLRLVVPKITSSEIDSCEDRSERSDTQMSIFGVSRDTDTRTTSISFSKPESDAVMSLLVQGKKLGPDTLALLFEHSKEEASVLLSKLQPRMNPPNLKSILIKVPGKDRENGA